MNQGIISEGRALQNTDRCDGLHEQKSYEEEKYKI